MLNVKELNKGYYEVSLKSTGIIVGTFELDSNGWYYFRPKKERCNGYWSEEYLRSLTLELEKLNKKLNDSVDKYFNFQ